MELKSFDVAFNSSYNTPSHYTGLWNELQPLVITLSNVTVLTYVCDIPQSSSHTLPRRLVVDKTIGKIVQRFLHSL